MSDSIVKRAAVRVADIAAVPLVAAAAVLLRGVRRIGLDRMPASRSVLRSVGVLPIRDHYYEPMIDPRRLRYGLDQVRELPGIDFDEEAQLEFIRSLRCANELATVPRRSTGVDGEFHFDNGTFGPGDADVWYAIVRQRKPPRIVEVGSGYSTLVARLAIERNMAEEPGYRCRHVCIEPYERPWLEATSTEVVRSRVEEVDRALFRELDKGDVLFIDSSHVIRPQGDVVAEYLEILPLLRPGVLVHVHDIFTPRDYPARWLDERGLLWNEQYLVEAFLTCNATWKIKAALNHLFHTHFDAFAAACSTLSKSDPEPGSLYLERLA